VGGVPSDRSLGRRDAEPLRENPNLHGPALCRRRPRDAYPSGQLQSMAEKPLAGLRHPAAKGMRSSGGAGTSPKPEAPNPKP
jgi:hypothetical protein